MFSKGKLTKAVRPDLPYMTAPETSLFKTLRGNGQLSVFKVTTCPAVMTKDGVSNVCGNEMHKDKLACCLACWLLTQKTGAEDGEQNGDG